MLIGVEPDVVSVCPLVSGVSGMKWDGIGVPGSLYRVSLVSFRLPGVLIFGGHGTEQHVLVFIRLVHFLLSLLCFMCVCVMCWERVHSINGRAIR